MIRIRDIRGQLTTLPPDSRFVEICSDEGKVAKVVFFDDGGHVRIFGPEDPEAIRYAKMMNINYAPIV